MAARAVRRSPKRTSSRSPPTRCRLRRLHRRLCRQRGRFGRRRSAAGRDGRRPHTDGDASQAADRSAPRYVRRDLLAASCFFWFGSTIAPSDIRRIALPVAAAVVFTLTFNVIAGHRRRPDLRLRSPCRLERSPDAPQPRHVRADPRLPRGGGRARQQNRAVRCALRPGALDPVARARRPTPVLARWLPPRFLAPRGTLQSRRTRRRTSVPMPPTPFWRQPVPPRRRQRKARLPTKAEMRDRSSRGALPGCSAAPRAPTSRTLMGSFMHGRARP